MSGDAPTDRSRSGRAASRGEGAVEVRPLDPADVPACEAILRGLPRWFGIEEALVGYVRALTVHDSWVALVDGDVVGMVTLEVHNPASAELHLLAVAAHVHRQGIGSRLVAEMVAECRRRAIAYLEVKTLGPSRPDEAYAATRAFYLAEGFLPLEENDLWGEVNPCLILVRHLACEGG